MKAFFKLILITALGANIHATAGEIGTLLKDDKLRTEPFADAKTTADIKRGESVEILKKQGGWLNVKSKQKNGWVRLLSVKRGSTSTGSATSDALKVASGRSGTGQVVATTGVRGLSAEELKGAKFNETEVKALESYTVSQSEATQFASAGSLKAVPFSTLKEPK